MQPRPCKRISKRNRGEIRPIKTDVSEGNGQRRHENVIYRAFAVVTAPIMKAARFVTPRFIVDQHIGYVAFFLLVVLWVLALALKVQAVLQAAKPPA